MFRSVYSIFFTLCIGFSSINEAYSREVLNVYTYHNKPPYFQSQRPTQAGIYKNLLDQLNADQDQFLLQLRYLPRKRLNQALEQGRLNGIVIGVNPIWFKDSEQKKYFWSPPFMSDMDIFVTSGSLKEADNKDFSGLRFSLTRGNYYKGISEQIKAGRIRLIESQSALQSVQMLSHDRADISILSESTAKYYQVQDRGLVILNEPHARFKRHIMFPKQFKQAMEIINPLITQ